MKLLTKNTDYAVRALLELARSKDFVSSRHIAQKQKIPYQYLRKILQEIIKTGWIETKEGKSGGFRLIENPSKINISKIIEVFQGKIELIDCLFRKKICENRAHCPIRREIKKIEKKVIKEFDALTLFDLTVYSTGEKNEEKNN